jgi:hypothetical protein
MVEARADVNLDVLRQFSNLQAMQQAQTDPGARLLGALPSLGSGMIAMPNGFASGKIVSFACFGSGRPPPLSGLLRGCFVSMDTMAQWNTHDLSRVAATIETPHIEGVAIDPPHIAAAHSIEGARIEGQEIRGVLIEAAHISAPNISAPSGVGQATSLSIG